MDIRAETVISLCSLGIAFILALIQVVKHFQDLRERKDLAENAATKAEAERDSIMIKGAENTLLMMQGMLDVANLSNKELRERMRELEQEGRAKDQRIYQLEQELRVANTRLAELEKRMTEQEKRNDV